MIELLHLLGVNPNLATKLVEQGTIEATLNIMKRMRLNEATMKSGLEALQKITSTFEGNCIDFIKIQ
jgi:predicted site-specific integrase-resolvase